MAHPHLSQALLGVNATTATTSVVATTTTAVSTGEILNQKAVSGFQQNNSSLIKSLLATKVNECMKFTTVIPDFQHVQVH